MRSAAEVGDAQPALVGLLVVLDPDPLVYAVRNEGEQETWPEVFEDLLDDAGFEIDEGDAVVEE